MFGSHDAQWSVSTSVISIFKGDYPASSGKSFCQLQSTFDSLASRVDKIAAVKSVRKVPAKIFSISDLGRLYYFSVNHQVHISIELGFHSPYDLGMPVAGIANGNARYQVQVFLASR